MKDTGKVNIHGKEYQTVASRVQKFRETFKQDYAIVTELVSVDQDTVVMKASISKGEQIIATGYAEENRNASMINKTSALENCETSAIGRALAAFGMAGTEYASADEVANAISQQAKPKPITAKPKNEELATGIQKQQLKNTMSALGMSKEDMGNFVESVLQKTTVDTVQDYSDIIAALEEK